MKKQKVCWKITTKCNQHCKYCFGFSNIEDLSYEDNEKVLENLTRRGIRKITWTGGEAVLYPRLNELIKTAKSIGIRNKLVTNGIFLAKNDTEYVEDIFNNLDEINLSIDSVLSEINEELGKEKNHLEIVKKVLDKVKNKKVKVGINTVVSKKNIEYLEGLGEFLNDYEIEKWKLLKFMPIREKSLQNKEKFEVSEVELKKKIKELKVFENIKKVQYKRQSEFEKSIVILPNANIIITQNGRDKYLGNALDMNEIRFIEENSKVKVLVAHDDGRIRKAIIDAIKGLDYIDVVGITAGGIETYNAMVDLKPELVFSKYNYSDMSGLDLVKKTKEKLQGNFPNFNTIGEIPDNELMQVVHIVNDKFNACVRLPDYEMAKDIVQSYKEYKYQ